MGKHEIPSSSSRGSSPEARVEALLRAGAPSRAAPATGRMRLDVLRAIRAGALPAAVGEMGTARGLREHAVRWWFGVGGALVGAAIVFGALALWPAATPTPPVHRPPIVLRIEPSRAPKLMFASAQLAERPLEEEARRLRADVVRGLGFLRDTVMVVR